MESYVALGSQGSGERVSTTFTVEVKQPTTSTGEPSRSYHKLQQKSHLCIPRKGIARPQSPPNFHTHMSMRGLYIRQPNRSQTHECGNLDWGRAISFLGIFVSNFRYCVFAVHWILLLKKTKPFYQCVLICYLSHIEYMRRGPGSNIHRAESWG